MKLTYTSVFSYLRIAIAGSLVISAAALGFTAMKTSSPPSLGKSTAKAALPNKFRRDVDQTVFAKIGDTSDNPASWADLNYQLNGGDQITAGDIAGARAAFSAIKTKGAIGNGKSRCAAR